LGFYFSAGAQRIRSNLIMPLSLFLCGALCNPLEYSYSFGVLLPLSESFKVLFYDDRGHIRGYSTKSPRKPTRLTKEQKDAIIFPPEIEEVITGMILSDACIAFSNRSKDAL